MLECFDHKSNRIKFKKNFCGLVDVLLTGAGGKLLALLESFVSNWFVSDPFHFDKTKWHMVAVSLGSCGHPEGSHGNHPADDPVGLSGKLHDTASCRINHNHKLWHEGDKYRLNPSHAIQNWSVGLALVVFNILFYGILCHMWSSLFT